METALANDETKQQAPTGGPSFALALGGGGARGLAHIHIIETLNDLGITPTVIAGSSIGALMGAGFAAGISGKDIHAHARSILGSRAEVASRLWKARPGNFAEMMEHQSFSYDFVILLGKDWSQDAGTNGYKFLYSNSAVIRCASN